MNTPSNGAAANQGSGGLPAPQKPGLVSANREQTAPAAAGSEQEMAMAVMMAAQQQLLLGQATPAQLAAANIAANAASASAAKTENNAQMQMWSGTLQASRTGISKPKAGPSFTPKLNLAKNPAMKAPGWQQLNSATSKGGMMKAGMPGLTGPGFAKRPPMPGPGMMSPPALMPPPEPDMSNVDAPEALAILESLKSIEVQTVLGTAVGKAAAPPVEDFAKAAPAKASPSKPICLQFEMGGCTKGADCPFSHEIG
jgi:hypothetical protein